MSYYIRLNYNNVLFKGLIDSGANISCTTPQMVKKLGLVATNNITGYVNGIGRTKILGEVRNCNLIVNDIRVVVNFIVLNNQDKNLVILGQDFLETYKCVIDCCNKKIKINSKIVPIVPFDTRKNITTNVVKPKPKPKTTPKTATPKTIPKAKVVKK